jgi:hypothetical protein
MQSIIKTTLLFLALFTMSFSSFADAQPEINTGEVRTRLGIIEGEYDLVEGERDLCIAGKYELRQGVNTLSLFADGGIFAAHIQRERFITNERGCSSNYSTRAITNGFENREEVHCPSQRISYVRIISAKFINSELTYKMQTHRAFENIKDSTTCKLKLKTEEES